MNDSSKKGSQEIKKMKIIKQIKKLLKNLTSEKIVSEHLDEEATNAYLVGRI